MSKKFIYNNNHTYARCFKTGRKHIVGRDYSGHWGVICNMCSNEIYGDAPYQVSLTNSEIVSSLHGKVSKENFSSKPKEKMVEVLMAGNREQSDFCNTCVGKMEDWRQKLNARALERANRK